MLLDLFFCEFFAFLFHFAVHLVQIVVEVLEDHVEFIRYEEDLLEFDDVGVVEFSEGLDFPQLYTFVPVGVFLFHFFNRDYFVGFSVHCFVDCTKSSVSQDLYRLVLVH